MSWPYIDLCKKDPCKGEEDCCCYTGPNLPATGISPGDCLNEVVQKIDAAIWRLQHPTCTPLEGTAIELDIPIPPTTTTTTTLGQDVRKVYTLAPVTSLNLACNAVSAYSTWYWKGTTVYPHVGDTIYVDPELTIPVVGNNYWYKDATIGQAYRVQSDGDIEIITLCSSLTTTTTTTAAP